MGRLIKRLTFVRRAPGIAAADFGVAWRGEVSDALAGADAGAGAATGAAGGLRRVALCVVRPGRGTPAYDGVALEWFDDAAAMVRWDQWAAAEGTAASPPAGGGVGAAVGAGGGAAVGAAVGAGVVDGASRCHLVVEERTVFGESWLDARWTDRDGAPALMLIGMIEPAPGLSRQAFRDYWWDRHRPLANQMVPSHLEPVAYVHNYVRPSEPGRWAGIGEMYEHSMDTARGRGAWFESESARPLVADEQRFLVRDTRELLVTDQYVIKVA